MCCGIYEVFLLIGGFHLLIDDFVHQPLYSVISLYQLAEVSQTNAVATIAHLILQLCQIVCQAIGSSGKINRFFCAERSIFGCD